MGKRTQIAPLQTGRTTNRDDVAEAAFSGTPGSLPYQSQMESAFGRSFSDVRVYTDQNANEALDAAEANGLAVGNSIAFATPNPDMRVVAHELAHVAQQSGGAGQTHFFADSPALRTSDPELDADRAADAVMSGHPVSLGAQLSFGTQTHFDPRHRTPRRSSEGNAGTAAPTVPAAAAQDSPDDLQGDFNALQNRIQASAADEGGHGVASPNAQVNLIRQAIREGMREETEGQPVVINVFGTPPYHVTRSQAQNLLRQCDARSDTTSPGLPDAQSRTFDEAITFINVEGDPPFLGELRLIMDGSVGNTGMPSLAAHRLNSRLQHHASSVMSFTPDVTTVEREGYLRVTWNIGVRGPTVGRADPEISHRDVTINGESSNVQSEANIVRQYDLRFVDNRLEMSEVYGARHDLERGSLLVPSSAIPHEEINFLERFISPGWWIVSRTPAR